MLQYQNTKIFCQSDPNGKKIIGTFYEKDFQKKSGKIQDRKSNNLVKKMLNEIFLYKNESIFS